jgi:hypothetical protein
MSGAYPHFQPSYSHDALVEHFLLTPADLPTGLDLPWRGQPLWHGAGGYRRRVRAGDVIGPAHMTQVIFGKKFSPTPLVCQHAEENQGRTGEKVCKNATRLSWPSKTERAIRRHLLYLIA